MDAPGRAARTLREKYSGDVDGSRYQNRDMAAGLNSRDLGYFVEDMGMQTARSGELAVPIQVNTLYWGLERYLVTLFRTCNGGPVQTASQSRARRPWMETRAARAGPRILGSSTIAR